MEDEFYVYLPSDSSKKLYDKNTLSHFKTHLPMPLNLSEDYVVGIAEIIYGRSIPDDVKSMELGTGKKPTLIAGPNNYNSMDIWDNDEHEKIEFPQNDWGSVEELFMDILSRVTNYHLGQQQLGQLYLMLRDVYNNHAPYKPPPEGYLKNSLTFKGKKIYFEVRHYSHLPDLVKTIHERNPDENLRKNMAAEVSDKIRLNMNYFHDKIVSKQNDNFVAFCYADCIRPSLTGDTLAKTLRVIELKRMGGSISFNPVYYHPITNSDIRDIEIQLLKNTGTPVRFRASNRPTVVLLHFKKKNL